ncbi:MAG: YihY/virulence factor BrkB family protein [Proteobacteria bacterium]|nr:YihY/virulence factor BrkB family protein [Pseudomonadota bacterium]MBU4295284.1 YihY/virulence factor BrkB family protein [Pseudomonadota bacterium]
MKPEMKSFLQINPGNGSIWSLRETELPLIKRLMLRMAKVCIIAARAPFNKQLLNHASALSFTFLLSLIPLLAMIFSIAKGFGIQDKIEPLLLEKAVGGEIASDLAPKIVEYVNNTNVAALGSIGLLFIAYTAISMLGQIEASFNTIWSIKKPRTFIRKASDYLSILIIGPLLLAVTLGLSTTLSSHAFTQKLLEIGLFAGAMKLFFLSIPWISSILILTLLFVIIPNTTVRVFPALLAGTITGCLWQLTQIIFIKFQIGVAKYNAIYGTFASVPIFMIWLQTTWILVLFGGVLNFACQNAGKFHPLEFEKDINFASNEKISLAVLLTICLTFDRGNGPSAPATISNRLGLSESFVRSALARLLEIGKILPVSSEENDLFVPAKPTAELKITHFFKDIQGKQADNVMFEDEEINGAIDKILELRQQAMETNFENKGMSPLV